MSELSERRRKRRQKPGRPDESIWVLLHNVRGATSEVRAKVLDASELGISIETECRMESNAVVTVDGQVGPNGSIGKARARVVDCQPFRGLFRAGLEFESAF